jgi:adenylate cyclase
VVVYDLRGVGGRHRLFLPERKDSMRPLARELPVSVTLIEGKQVQDAAVAGALVKASPESAELRAPMALAAFANLRLRLPAPDGRAEIYAKVTSIAGPSTFVLRFTSVDPEAARLIERALAG